LRHSLEGETDWRALRSNRFRIEAGRRGSGFTALTFGAEEFTALLL